MWPKFEDKIVGERLAFTGAVKDQIMDTELLAMRLLDFLKVEKNPIFVERFKLQNEPIEDIESYELLELIGRKRGMLISVAKLILKELLLCYLMNIEVLNLVNTHLNYRRINYGMAKI